MYSGHKKKHTRKSSFFFFAFWCLYLLHRFGTLTIETIIRAIKEKKKTRKAVTPYHCCLHCCSFSYFFFIYLFEEPHVYYFQARRSFFFFPSVTSFSFSLSCCSSLCVFRSPLLANLVDFSRLFFILVLVSCEHFLFLAPVPQPS